MAFLEKNFPFYFLYKLWYNYECFVDELSELLDLQVTILFLSVVIHI